MTEKLNERIKSGEIIEQKCWKFIKELNSGDEERLDAVALIDGSREYTYRQMFRKWERYAKVFSALGITGENHSRVMMSGTPCAETINALFALNMTGASVSISLKMGDNSMKRLRATKEEENITDLLLPDCSLDGRYLERVARKKDELGIRNVIVMHVPLMGEFSCILDEPVALMRYSMLKGIPGVLFMDDLLRKYRNAEISYAETECDDAAVITHTSGTTTGASKPVPTSDRGINETSIRLLEDSRFKPLAGKITTCLTFELGSSYSLFNETILPLAFGGKIAVLPDVGLGPDALAAVSYYHANVFFGGPMIMDMLMSMPGKPDLSDLELVFLGGSYASVDAKKRYNKFLKKCGSKARVTVGYGLSEAGGACILSTPDREDDSIGKPLAGIKVKIYDEEKGKFFDPSDGPVEGIMYMNSPSVSSGRIDDKVIFELEEIDGEQYLNTYDLVMVDEEGTFYYAGRMNKFFVNNKNVRFDAGLVERAVTAQPDIESCGLAPAYDKALRDTVPVLYVKPVMSASKAKDAVRDALKGAFIDEGVVKETNLPSECIITDEIPYNAMGKVDVHQITKGTVDGYRYRVIPERLGRKLIDVRLETYRNAFFVERGLPEELSDE